MRFGLINMFPTSVNPNVGGQASTQYVEGEKNKQHQGTVDQSQTKISIFSGYETGTPDGTVTKDEALSFKLFKRGATDQSDAILSTILNTDTLKARAKSIAAKNFESKIQKVFEGAIKFNMTNVKQIITGANTDIEAQKQSAITNLNNSVMDEANKASQAAMVNVNAAYQEALKNAAAEVADAKSDAGNGNERLTSDEIDGILGADTSKAKGPNKNNTEYQKTAYSTYDNNTDGTVTKTEVRFTELNIDKYLTNGVSENVKAAFRADANSIMESMQNAFSVETGSTEVTGKTEKEVNDAVQKFAKGVDKKVDMAVKAYTGDLDNTLRAQSAQVIQAAVSEKGLDGRARPISVNVPGFTMGLIPNGDGYTLQGGPKGATYDFKPGIGGSIMYAETTQAQSNQSTVTTSSIVNVVLDGNGSVKNIIREEKNPTPGNSSVTSDVTTTVTTPGENDSESTKTTTRREFKGGSSITVNGSSFESLANNMVGFFFKTNGDNDGSTPVTVQRNGEGWNVIGSDNKPIEGANVQSNNGGTFNVTVNGKSYTVKADANTGVTANEVTSADAAPANTGQQTYTVQKGDNLTKIAGKYKNGNGQNANWNELASVNNLRAPYTIYPKQNLKIPGDWVEKK